jgi:hypothetical protein
LADFGYAVLLRVHELLRYIIRYSIVECLGFSPVSLNDDEMMLDTGKAECPRGRRFNDVCSSSRIDLLNDGPTCLTAPRERSIGRLRTRLRGTCG